MTARLSDRVEADAGWSSCGQEGASDLSGEVCPGFGAVWLSMTSALYTMEDQWNKGQMGVFCLSPCLPCLSVNLSVVPSSSPQSCLFVATRFFLKHFFSQDCLQNCPNTFIFYPHCQREFVTFIIRVTLS